ncbi:hypothetical protein JNUCC23_23225 (plasmid) [Peribacillus sp. JNUCC 23]
MSLYRKSKAVSRIEGLVNAGQLNRKAYETLRDMLTSEAVSLDKLNKVTRNNVYKKIFYYKFFISCYNARNVRCGRKKGYENVQYMLGDERGLIIRLSKNNPQLAIDGINIIKRYIESGFDYGYAPCIHRKEDSGHYDWQNIMIMARKDHDQLKVKDQQEHE